MHIDFPKEEILQLKSKQKYSVEEVESYKNEIQELIKSYPDNYSRMITAKTRRYLKDFIEYKTPLLNDSFYKMSTKCYWIIHDLTEFPICKVCGKKLKYNVKVNVGYGMFCSYNCAQKSELTQQKIKKTKKELYGSETYNNSKKAKETNLKKYGVSNPNKCKSVRDKIKNTCLKKYGVDHNFKSKECIKKRKRTWIDKYGTDNPKSTYIVQKHYEETCIKKYGVRNISQVKDIQRKKHAFYRFDNQWFDSSWELCFYIYNKDHGISLIHEPRKISYVDRYGKCHYYFPDFEIDNTLIEIKGNQFYTKNNKPLDKYRDKFDFMKSIHVKILRYDDIKAHITYVNNKYGKNYIRQFRKR